MKKSTAAVELIDLELSIEEHRSLAELVSTVLFTTSWEEMVMHLRTSPEVAHEFLQSLCVLEARAALAGIPWLDPRGSRELVRAAARFTPTVGIRFTVDGSVWQLTLDQFALIGRCLGARPELMRWAA